MAKKNKYADWAREDLIKRITSLEKRKKYGLVWNEERTKEKFEADAEGKLPVIKEVKSKEIKTDSDKPTHILIEGDNYHSLSVLNYTHEKAVDVIYIDPPYNTENKEFKYNDTYIDSNDAYRHSKWLSFMSKRLRLAKNLLKKSGAIFISINEEEFAHLKVLCDELFGAANYLTTFTIKVRHEDRILKGDKDFHEVVEYLLLYRRSDEFKPLKRQKDNTSLSDYVYEVKELFPKPSNIKLGNKKVEVFGPGEYEVIKGEPDETKLKKINIRGSIKEGNSSGRFYMKYLESVAVENRGYLYKIEGIGGDDLGYRYFLLPKSSSKVNGDYFQGVPIDRKDIKEFPFPNYFDFEEDFNNVGYEGGVDFRNGKKPISFIQKILEIARCIEKKDAVILDFFAGSGSTGHAILDSNNGDGGRRIFILCTNNEVDYKTEKMLESKGFKKGDAEYEREGICKKITYPRMEKVIHGYREPNGTKIEGLGGNLKYYRTAFVPAEPTDRNKELLTKEAVEMLCLRENTFEFVLENDSFKIFKNNEHYTGIIFDQLSIPKFKKAVSKFDLPAHVYVFSLGDDDFADEFADMKRAVKVCSIPEAILRVYRRIFK